MLGRNLVTKDGSGAKNYAAESALADRLRTDLQVNRGSIVYQDWAQLQE